MWTLTSDRDFFKKFLISFGVHIGFVVLAYFGGTLFVKVFKLDSKVEIIRSSVRVDVVGMPKFTIKELRAMQSAPVPKPVEEAQGSKVETKIKDDTPDVIKKDDLVIQQKGEQKKNSFMNLISDYSSKKISAKEKSKGAAKGVKQNIDSLILEGNRISKGSALVGDYSDEQNSAFSAYVQTLPELVRSHWKLPSYLMNQGHKCRIAVYLSSTGQVLKTELIESSGVGEFDSRAEKAIRDASPFPKPSDEVSPRLASSGVILRFPL